jgi:hypothetical protein
VVAFVLVVLKPNLVANDSTWIDHSQEKFAVCYFSPQQFPPTYSVHRPIFVLDLSRREADRVSCEKNAQDSSCC